jgi:hypothetical protein
VISTCPVSPIAMSPKLPPFEFGATCAAVNAPMFPVPRPVTVAPRADTVPALSSHVTQTLPPPVVPLG